MDSNSSFRSYGPRRRISIFFPLLLIIAGVVLLLTNMKLVDWDIWDAVFLLWPVLFIAGGLDGLIQGENPVWQVFWLGVGALLLMGNLGYLAWSTWDIVARLWPLLLIAAGLSVLAGKSNVGSLVSAGMVVALLGGALLLLSQAPLPAVTVEGDRISQSLDGASKSNIDLNLSAGKLRLTAMPESTGQIEACCASRTRATSRRAITCHRTPRTLPCAAPAWPSGFRLGRTAIKANGICASIPTLPSL